MPAGANRANKGKCKDRSRRVRSRKIFRCVDLAAKSRRVNRTLRNPVLPLVKRTAAALSDDAAGPIDRPVDFLLIGGDGPDAKSIADRPASPNAAQRSQLCRSNASRQTECEPVEFRPTNAWFGFGQALAEISNPHPRVDQNGNGAGLEHTNAQKCEQPSVRF